MSRKIIIKINGNEYILHKIFNVQELLIFIRTNVDNNTIALEYNKKLIRKEQYDNINLKNKDIIEIVSVVGGG